MPPKDDEAPPPPWRKLFHEQEEAEAEERRREQEQQLQQQQQQLAAGGDEEQQLTELQQQMLQCYRKTFLVAGFGLVGSMWRWNMVTKHKQPQVFLPPRAQALPEAVVQRWKQKAQFREAVRTIGRQTLSITAVAGLYFGTELGVGLWRGVQGADWANTAAAGAVAGGVLGTRVPSSMRGRTMAVGALVGGMLGAASGWTQQQVMAFAAEQEQQQQLQQPPPQQQQQQPSQSQQS